MFFDHGINLGHQADRLAQGGDDVAVVHDVFFRQSFTHPAAPTTPRGSGLLGGGCGCRHAHTLLRRPHM